MKKTIGISILFVLFVFGAIAQPTTAGGAYNESQARQARENAEKNRHYESMKPSKKSTSNSNVSGDYNSNGWGQGIGSERVAAGERNDALQKEWNDKVNKLVKLIQSRKIGKTSSDYSSFMEAAKESFTGYNSDYTIRTIFPKTASEYEQKANDKSSNFYKQWFLVADKMKPVIKTTTSNNTQPTYNSQPVLHNTQYGTSNTIHPKFFSEVNAVQKDKGYTKIDDIAEFVQIILNDGVYNYVYVTDKSTKYENAKCNCDAVFGLKVYYKDYTAMEFGVFKGGDRWKYPFLRMYITTNTKEECESVFDDFKKKFANNIKYKKYQSQYTRDDRDVYFDYNQNDGFTYQVWMEKTSDLSIRMGIDKQDAPIVEKAINNATYQSLQLNDNKKEPTSQKVTLKQLSFDDDEDGVPNQEDACPTEKGNAVNKGCPEKIKNLYSGNTSLEKLNNYLKTFDGGYYGRFELIGKECYIRLKSGNYYRFEIKNLDKAYALKQDKKVEIRCIAGSSCMTLSLNNRNSNAFVMYQASQFDADELAKLINDVLAEHK